MDAGCELLNMLSRVIIILLLCGVFLIMSCNHKDKSQADIPGAEMTQADSMVLTNTTNSYVAGKYLFVQYCKPCHYRPDAGVPDQYIFDRLFERLPEPTEDYLINFLSDSKALRTAGNKYAIKVHELWNSSYEHRFKDSISKNEFGYLITYIKIASVAH